jgi:signal transduction histidine kinase
MKDEVGRMSKLVGDLLTLARADSGTLELNRESFDLRMVADQVARTLQPIVAKKEQTFTLTGDEMIPVFADRERITQLLYILLDNAMKYTPEKGGISLGIEASGKGIQIIVKDNGVGMTPQQAERIFDRFYRVDKGRSREMGGTGLGLSIANWIVTAHGGTIQVQSNVGKGSTFTIALPIQDKEHKLQ